MTFLVTNPMTADGAQVCTHSEIGNEQLANKSSSYGKKHANCSNICVHIFELSVDSFKVGGLFPKLGPIDFQKVPEGL